MTVSVEMEVALPRFVQVLLAGGDRYLAANLGGFRALMAATDKMRPEHYLIQAKVQQDVAWFNPAHEDNFYIAAAMLPWAGQVGPAQEILARAHAARPVDWRPAFYYAFNQYEFAKDPIDGARWLRLGAQRARDAMDRLNLENLAARWFEKGHDPQTAVVIVEAMAAEARESAFKTYLLMRAERLKALIVLREAAQQYKNRFGQPPRRLDQLVKAGLIARLPADPFGFGYGLDPHGVPTLHNAPQTK